MNKEVLNSKTFEEWVQTMDVNAEGANFDVNEAKAKSDNPCYIADNAEILDDIVSYQDLIKEAEEWLQTDEAKESNILRGWNPTAEDIVQDFFDVDRWCFFGTFLDELTF